MTTPRPPGEPRPEEAPAVPGDAAGQADAGQAVVVSRGRSSPPVPETGSARATPPTGFAAPPPQHPTPPTGLRSGPDSQSPLPPPPQHGQPVGQFRRPYSRPLPPGRSSARLPAPPPQHGSPHGGFPAALSPDGWPRGTATPPGQPFGRPASGGPPPQLYGRPYGQARSPGRSLLCYQPPEQFAHPQHAGDSTSYGPQPLPVPPSQQVSNEVRPLAGFRPRAISFLIDLVAPSAAVALLLLLGVAVGSAVLTVLFGVLGAFGLIAFVLSNSCYLQGVTGQSIGRRVAGTKLVKIETGAPVGFGTAFVRQLCHGVEFGIGYLWPLWDIQRQTFADKITATLVVRVDR